MKTYWTVSATNEKNYYVNISPEWIVEIWEDTNHDRYSEAGTVANFRQFLKEDFYQRLIKDNMGEAILQEVIASIHEIQNEQI